MMARCFSANKFIVQSVIFFEYVLKYQTTVTCIAEVLVRICRLSLICSLLMDTHHCSQLLFFLMCYTQTQKPQYNICEEKEEEKLLSLILGKMGMHRREAFIESQSQQGLSEVSWVKAWLLKTHYLVPNPATSQLALSRQTTQSLCQFSPLYIGVDSNPGCPSKD